MQFPRTVRFANTAALLAVLLGGCSDQADTNSSVDTFLGWNTLKPLNFDDSTDPVDFTLSGTLWYQDRTYDQQGFTGTQNLPIRFARVQLLDADGNPLAETSTDATGWYTIGAHAGQVRLRIIAATSPIDSGIDISVQDNEGLQIAVAKDINPAPDGNALDLTVPLENAAGAFNILDVLSTGAEYYNAQQGTWPGSLIAHWRPGESPRTTSFCGWCGVPTMYVMGGSDPANYGVGDTDEFDDDVLWHEYGHFLEHQFGVLDSMGGVHYLQHTDQDMRLAWSEGWSNFVSGAIKAWVVAQGRYVSDPTAGTDSGLYVDTAGTLSQIAYNFRTLELGYWDDGVWQSGTAEINLATNEGAVAKMLWDVRDDVAFQDTAVWRAFSDHMPTTSWASSLETFWDGLLSTNAGMTAAEQTALLAHFRGRQVEYALDAYETDSEAAPIPVDGAVVRNLYPGDLGTTESDWWAFTGVAGSSYRIETFGLKNGIDTVVEVIRPTDRMAFSNDNHDGRSYTGSFTSLNIHDGCKLASRVDIPADQSVDGTWLVKVSIPPVLSAAAGRYGSYQLNVQQNDLTTSLIDCTTEVSSPSNEPVDESGGGGPMDLVFLTALAGLLARRNSGALWKGN